jgi:probable F420-dependent oxidoreductase
MRFGFGVPNSGPLSAPAHQVRLAQTAERLGYDAIWTTDHIVLPVESSSRYPYNEAGRLPVDPDGDYYEPLVGLAYLGGVTQRIRLGISVLVLPYRNPVVTAKQLSTLDALTGGRLIVGVGAGWLAEEFEAVQAPPFADRGTVTDECIQIFRLLWTEQRPDFEGRFFTVRNIGFNPKPVQQPHPPILVGGDAPPALRRVARHGDGWQPYNYTPDGLKAQLDLLRAFCVEAGRNYDDLTISLRLGVRIADRPNEGLRPNEDPRQVTVGTPAELTDLCKRYQDLGVHEIGFNYRSTPSVEDTELTMERLMSEVAPAMR